MGDLPGCIDSSETMTSVRGCTTTALPSPPPRGALAGEEVTDVGGVGTGDGVPRDWRGPATAPPTAAGGMGWMAADGLIWFKGNLGAELEREVEGRGSEGVLLLLVSGLVQGGTGIVLITCLTGVIHSNGLFMYFTNDVTYRIYSHISRT